jgi:NMD protein affecting ribosome stability and mRNA decay
MSDQGKCVRCGHPNVVEDHLCHQCREPRVTKGTYNIDGDRE